MKHIEWWVGQFAGHTVRLRQHTLPPYTWQALKVWTAWQGAEYYGAVIQNGAYGWNFANPTKDKQTTIAVGMPFNSNEMSLKGYSPTVERDSGGVLHYVAKVRRLKPKCDHPECLWLKAMLANTIIPAFKRGSRRLTTSDLLRAVHVQLLSVERDYCVTSGDVEWAMLLLGMERTIPFALEWRPKPRRK